MSKPTGHKPRHKRDGRYQRECAYCGVSFRTDNHRTMYCSFAHKAAANNKTYYAGHKNEIIVAVLRRRDQQTIAALKARVEQLERGSAPRAPKRAKSQPVDFDSMTHEELAEYIRLNPDQVRGRR